MAVVSIMEANLEEYETLIAEIRSIQASIQSLNTALLVEGEVGEARVVADQRRALRVARHGICQQRMQAARTRREAAHIALEMRFGRDGRPVHLGKRHDSWP